MQDYPPEFLGSGRLWEIRFEYAFKLREEELSPATSNESGVLGALLESGARITEQRKLVASIIDQVKEHADADEIYRRARKTDPRISLSTVYRTLALLKSEGLVQDHRFDQEHAHFEPAVDKRHQHIICRECGAVAEFDLFLDDIQRSELESETGFVYVAAQIEAVGVCPECRRGDTRVRRP